MEKKLSQIEFFSVEKKRLSGSDEDIAEDISVMLKSKSGLVFDAGCGEGVYTNIAANFLFIGFQIEKYLCRFCYASVSCSVNEKI